MMARTNLSELKTIRTRLENLYPTLQGDARESGTDASALSARRRYIHQTFHAALSAIADLELFLSVPPEIQQAVATNDW